MRWLAVLALTLLLPGCWLGPDFYAASDLRQPIPAGDYRMTGPNPRERLPDRVRVAVLPNGLSHLIPVGADGQEIETDRTTLGFATLDADAGLFIGWQVDAGPDGDMRAYWIMRREGDRFTMLMPPCEGELAEIARAAGARASEQSGVGCHFSSRQDLERGLRTVLPRLEPGLSLTPLAPR